ncbi:MAG: hypothetical protein LBU04_04180, partial [Christensenellaceae bacterium]|nr:hypothetical protein [Christensenellaceae bacterium]
MQLNSFLSQIVSLSITQSIFYLKMFSLHVTVHTSYGKNGHSPSSARNLKKGQHFSGKTHSNKRFKCR